MFKTGDRLKDSEKSDIINYVNVSKEIDRIIKEGKHSVSKEALWRILSRVSLTDKSVGAINELYELAQKNKGR